MDAKQIADVTSTGAGSAAGLTMLATVRWDGMPAGWGEPIKLAVAMALICLGYVMYGSKTPPKSS